MYQRKPGRSAEAHRRGLAAEAAACAAIERDGWVILGRRVRTEGGEIDILAAKESVLAVIEVKARRTLSDAAAALSARQRKRLVAAAEIVMAENPGWGSAGMRFDVLVVDQAGVVRRIADAFRPGESTATTWVP